MKPDRIQSLTGLRALVMLTIFGCHLSYLAETPFRACYEWMDNGRLGVNFFLVLSGFGMALGYSGKLNADNHIPYLPFVKRRLSNIYTPYLITLALAIPLYLFRAVSGGWAMDGGLFVRQLILNITMLQSAMPFALYTVSINEVAWFVSTIFIIYLFAPGILRFNHKLSRYVTVCKLFLSIIVVLFLNSIVFIVIGQIEYVYFADRGLSIIYRNPLIRVFPFLLGIIAYNFYQRMDNFRLKHSSLAEISGIVLFVLWWMTADQTGLSVLARECTDMLLSMALVLLFAFSRNGIVSIFLSRERLIHLGGMSLDFYLLHNLVIQYGLIAAKHFRLDQGIAVIPLTILFLAVSLYGACRIHHFSKCLLALRKE